MDNKEFSYFTSFNYSLIRANKHRTCIVFSQFVEISVETIKFLQKNLKNPITKIVIEIK